MKQYLLFAGGSHYPAGGTGDYIGDYDTVNEAEAAGRALRPKDHYCWKPEYVNNSWTKKYVYDWWEVVDHSDMRMFSGGTNR